MPWPAACSTARTTTCGSPRTSARHRTNLGLHTAPLRSGSWLGGGSCRSYGVVPASLVEGRRVGAGRVVEDFAFVVIPLPGDNSGVVPDLDGGGGHAEQGGHLGERDQAGGEQPLAAAG